MPGHDVAYLTSGQHAGGCAGAMSYYTASGEPPGQWAGKGAAALGLAGQVDPAVIGRLYQHNIGPGGELLVKPPPSRAADEREAAAVAAYRAAHPYASATELAEVRAAERGKDPHQVPYFDLTVNAVKSVSVLHASYRVSARQARERGEQDQAAALDARADQIEAALMDAAREAVAWLERHATYTRTGHHSARTGEWRDGDGLAASVFLHHISRDGDPHLHVHVAVWNRVQRADGADEKWRTLDSRSLHNQRLAVAPVTDRMVETRLSALGYAMVPRPDGNGAEVGGVSQDVMDLFSSRRRALTPELNGPDRTLPEDPRQAAVQAHDLAARPAGRAEHPAHQGRSTPHRRRADRHRRAHRGAAAGRLGSTDPRSGKCRPCRRCTSRWPGSPPGTPGVHRRCWTMRPSAQPRVSPSPRCNGTTRSGRWLSSGSRCTGRCRCCHQAPTPRRWSPRWPSWPSAAGPGPKSSRSPPRTLTDVTSLGVRASDGGSIYRPPNEQRYCTLAHLDTEQQILTAATRTVPQLVSHEQARAAVERTDLTAGQRDAVVTMLTAATTTTALVAAAGAGKSHTMAGFARLWTTFTGRRVIGLTTLDERGPGPGQRGPGRVLQHRRVPRQDRRLRRAAPTRAPAPGRRAGAG